MTSVGTFTMARVESGATLATRSIGYSATRSLTPPVIFERLHTSSLRSVRPSAIMASFGKAAAVASAAPAASFAPLAPTIAPIAPPTAPPIPPYSEPLVNPLAMALAPASSVSPSARIPLASFASFPV